MDERTPKQRLRQVGTTAWRTTVLALFTLIVLVMFVGMAFLVYRGRMDDGPLIIFAGVLLGYLLRAVQEVIHER